MENRVYKQTAPSDSDALKAWSQIMSIASRHALIVQSYGGVTTLALPGEQRKAGIRQKVLTSELMNETEQKGD